MSDFVVRQFRRADRDQLTDLVNAHVAAVLPRATVSVNTVLTHLERRPGEFIVDPWVERRVTLVAEQDMRVVAAGHLLRYADRADVADSYRDGGELAWLLFWPGTPAENSYWRDASSAAQGLMTAAFRVLDKWNVTQVMADCSLPAPACYGVADQWPHIHTLYADAGLTPARTEIVLVADVADLPEVSPMPGVQRSLGINGTRLTAIENGAELGYIEIDTNLAGFERLGRREGLADVGNFHVDVRDGDQRTESALLAAAREWLDFAGIDRLLAYADTADEAEALRLWGSATSPKSHAAGP